ncbi:hypothetical protein ACFYWS_26195 [Streptomyces sp. NPDC002795]|uniref:hypothetical protein n=1 Tax=Streptomyces sp. NPDC002795 TaxID=3364665 RepID=UPI0036AD6F3E
MAPLVFTTLMLCTALAKAGPYALADVRLCFTPGSGRHRRGGARHAARGGRR